MISIIIPVYNAERYLLSCLKSIVSQQTTDYEVIIVDDCSTDCSADIYEEFVRNHPHFSCFRLNKNQGVSAARNFGLLHAKGEWVSFVDADDVVSEDYLTTFIELEEKADITFFGATLFGEEPRPQNVVSKACWCADRQACEEALYDLKCGDYDVLGWTWNKFFRRELVRKWNVRFVETVTFREDELFTLEYCRHISTLRVIGKSLYHYRITSNGLTKRGLQKSDLRPSSLHMEEDLAYYSHPGLCERILSSATDYRAMDIYASPLCEVKSKLDDYCQFINKHPQPGKKEKINHLTNYLRHGYWSGFFYCLIRRL